MLEDKETAELTEEERSLMARHLSFYRSLATGQRKPTTAAQKDFVEVALGHTGAETAHEIAYIKYMRLMLYERTLKQIEPNHDPDSGPTDAWFTRADWKKLRARQRFDGK